MNGVVGITARIIHIYLDYRGAAYLLSGLTLLLIIPRGFFISIVRCAVGCEED